MTYQGIRARLAQVEQELAECRKQLPFSRGVVTWVPPAHVNTANITALGALIEEAHGAGIPRDLLPVFLAARGVLAPASLSDEDRAEIETEMGWGGKGKIAPLLERIAKGEGGTG
jgi:hypothetical protein